MHGGPKKKKGGGGGGSISLGGPKALDTQARDPTSLGITRDTHGAGSSSLSPR